MPLPPSSLFEKEELLASIRNLQFSASFNSELVEKYTEELIQLGLRNEAEALLTRLTFA